MASFRNPLRVWAPLALGSAAALALVALDAGKPGGVATAEAQSRSEGKATPKVVGRVRAGRDVFRFETFGNEGFWTDAARMPKGMMDAKVTPLQALQAGLLVDVEAVPQAMRDAMAAELKTDLSPQNAPMLNDPMTTVKLIEANAVVGIVPKDSNGDGKIDIASGDKIGVSCALCHTITDKSVHAIPGAGSIGRRIDGPAALQLNMGKLLAMAANSRAVYPNLQLTLGGKTIGRAPTGLTPDSTEAEVDAYLSNPQFYPVGTFDETQDGNGNSVINTPLFRQDLAAPYGSAGEFAKLVDISNGSYTTNLDPTTLVTPEGRAFLKIKAGAAGEQLANDYAKVLADTGVTGFPFVQAKLVGNVGDPASPVGRRVDEQKLADMKAYLEALPAPKGGKVDAAASARGRKVFVAANCTACHNVDQSKPVARTLVDMEKIMPGYAPKVLAQRDPPLSPVQNSPGTFDDKMIVVDASDRGTKRGNAIPMLLDLDRRTVLLHDASVNGFDELLTPSRGATAPHPFYVGNAAQRSDLIQFLRGLQTESASGGKRG
jgi:cytochrome c2